MTLSSPNPRHRRRWLFALLAIVLVFTAGAPLLRHFLRPQALTAILIEQARSALGADLSLGGAAHFRFVPKLHLVLPYPALTAPGAHTAFLRANSLEVVVPWHTLWANRYDIDRLDLDKPTLDLDEFSTWFDARPSSGNMPDVRFSLRVEGGTISSGGKPVAQGVQVDFASSGDLAAWLAKLAKVTPLTALVPPLRGSAAAETVSAGSTRLEGVRIEIRDDSAGATPTTPAPGR